MCASLTAYDTRLQMAELMTIQECDLLVDQVMTIPLEEITSALQALDNGTAKGRFAVVF